MLHTEHVVSCKRLVRLREIKLYKLNEPNFTDQKTRFKCLTSHLRKLNAEIVLIMIRRFLANYDAKVTLL